MNYLKSLDTRHPVQSMSYNDLKMDELRNRIEAVLNESNLQNKIKNELNKPFPPQNVMRNNLLNKYAHENFNLMRLLLITLLLILIFGYFAFRMAKSSHKEKTGYDLSFYEFLLGNKILNESGNVDLFLIFNARFIKAFAVGMVSNFVFGMIDNGGLWLGMSSLDPFMTSDPLTKSALGNAYSNGLGAFLGTFIGFMITIYSQVEDTPLISDVIGVVLGCVLVIPLMRLLTGQK